MSRRFSTGSGKSIFPVIGATSLLLTILLAIPQNGFATVVLSGSFREVGAGIVYTFGDTTGSGSSWTQVDYSSVNTYESGEWSGTAEAKATVPPNPGVPIEEYVPGFIVSMASQNSNIALSAGTDTLSATASGFVHAYFPDLGPPEPTYSLFSMDFTIDSGPYNYSFNLNHNGYGYMGVPIPDTVMQLALTLLPGNDFLPNTSGTIGPGTYTLGIRIQDWRWINWPAPNTGYELAFSLQPVDLPTDGGGTGPSPVPEPSTLLLMGSGLACLAGRRWKK